MRCQVFGIAVGDRLEGEAAGDVDQRVQPAEMRADGIDRLSGLGGVGEVDAAELEPVRRCRNLRRRVIDAGNPRAARQRLSATTLPSAPARR